MAPSATDPQPAAAGPGGPPASRRGAGAFGMAAGLAVMRGFARGWWLFLLRGVVAIAFGVIALANPALGLIGLLAFLAAWMLFDGVFTIAHAIAGPREPHGIWFWLDGIVSILAAAVIFLAPGLSAVALVIVAGAWWAVTGGFEIVAAVRQRSWLLGLAGLASLALGLLVLAWPGPGLLALVWFAAIQALLFGGLMIALGLRLRRVAARRMEAAASAGGGSASAGASGAGKAPFAPGATNSAIAPTGVPAVDAGEPASPPANDPGQGQRGRGAA